MPATAGTSLPRQINRQTNAVIWHVRLVDRPTLVQRGRDTAWVRRLDGVELALTGPGPHFRPLPVDAAPADVAESLLRSLLPVTRVDQSADGRYWLQMDGREIGWAEIDDSFALAASLTQPHPLAAKAQALIDFHVVEIATVTAQRDALTETDVMRARLTHRIGQLRGTVALLQTYVS